MIIVLGKKDKAMLADAAIYCSERGDVYQHFSQTVGKEHYMSIAKDCWSIADRLRKLAKVKVKSS